MSLIYVPILKWKRGEQVALQNVNPTIKQNLTPLIEIVPPPYDYENDLPAKTIDDHIKNTASQIEAHWGHDSIYLDLIWIDDEEMLDGSNPLKFILSETRKRNLKVIPVVGYNRSASYIQKVKNANTQDRLGICLRLEDDDFLDLSNHVSSVLTEINVEPKDIDLLIDFKSISPNDDKKNLISAISIINSIPYIMDWRTVTFAASAFPENMSSVSPSVISSVPRSEWNIWQQLNSSQIKRIPNFGDYAIAHPNFVDVDPRVMQMSANLRYTIKNNFLLCKGKSIKKNGWGQMQGICSQIVSHPHYAGETFSWGDKYIKDCSTGTTSTGNAETWRRVGTNHHLTQVVNQLSSFSAP
jgi:hypothetical protein